MERWGGEEIRPPRGGGEGNQLRLFFIRRNFSLHDRFSQLPRNFASPNSLRPGCESNCFAPPVRTSLFLRLLSFLLVPFFHLSKRCDEHFEKSVASKRNKTRSKFVFPRLVLRWRRKGNTRILPRHESMNIYIYREREGCPLWDKELTLG